MSLVAFPGCKSKWLRRWRFVSTTCVYYPPYNLEHGRMVSHNHDDMLHLRFRLVTQGTLSRQKLILVQPMLIIVKYWHGLNREWLFYPVLKSFEGPHKGFQSKSCDSKVGYRKVLVVIICNRPFKRIWRKMWAQNITKILV